MLLWDNYSDYVLRSVVQGSGFRQLQIHSKILLIPIQAPTVEGPSRLVRIMHSLLSLPGM